MESYQKSIELFSKQIELLYNNQQLLYEFSKNAREAVEINSWKNKAKKMVEIYESVVLNNA